jgi:tyrosyl-DNA phosphodiesterase 2
MEHGTLKHTEGGWVRTPIDSCAEVTATTLKVLTYNVWFEDHEFSCRTTALLDIIASSDADFVCLQEVTDRFADALSRDERLRAKYYFPDKPVRSYIVFILAKYPVAFRELGLRSGMGRSLVAAHFKLNGQDAVVSTVHLESLDNARLRAEQLATIFPYISCSLFAILCGDFNFDHTWRDEQANLQLDFVDSWAALHDLAAEPGHTMPATPRFPAWRPDRVMLKSSAWRVVNVEIVGRDVLEKFRHFADPTPTKDNLVKTPSDHYGLLTTLTL